MSEAVTVTATRWSGGWELEIDEDTDHSDWTITVIPETAPA